ncbi:hypothetical protein D3C85_373610 [compost metagenome]
MTISEENKLDNPVWYSLSENHQEFAIDYGNTKFYDPNYGPFGGLQNWKILTLQPKNMQR